MAILKSKTRNKKDVLVRAKKMTPSVAKKLKFDSSQSSMLTDPSSCSWRSVR